MYGPGELPGIIGPLHGQLGPHPPIGPHQEETTVLQREDALPPGILIIPRIHGAHGNGNVKMEHVPAAGLQGTLFGPHPGKHGQARGHGKDMG